MAMSVDATHETRPVTALVQPIEVAVSPPPGFWQRDASHMPNPLSPMYRSFLPNATESFRRMFAALDDAQPQQLAALWKPLADLLEVHAAAEEAIFYPSLLKHGSEAKPETKDAIKDHNKIRDAVRDANAATPGEDDWWKAVRKALDENSDHMAEEEREGLPDFRRNASKELRDELGALFAQFHAEHPHASMATPAVKPPPTLALHRRWLSR